mmetsp:Transcript_54215/g.100188  ORF Transcript_54215/g.100188 Transcript_54215/m.100188 type:complete len:440 (-) Transcript_54215:171-1490(-)
MEDGEREEEGTSSGSSPDCGSHVTHSNGKSSRDSPPAGSSACKDQPPSPGLVRAVLKRVNQDPSKEQHQDADEQVSDLALQQDQSVALPERGGAVARPEEVLIGVEEVGKRVLAQDLQGQAHRAREWKGRTACYFGGDGPIEVVRKEQRSWVENNPDQVLKWTFPTKRRDCLRISFRSIEKMESITSSEFRSAFVELIRGYPATVVRSISYLYLNYLQPHHKRIQAQGRHLLMLKVYESKNEVHFWHIPLKEVRELHVQSAEAMRGGVSLNDVQLVETYAVESTFALHAETFARNIRSNRESGHHGNLYGECTWVGGMAIHLVTEDEDDPVLNKSRQFAAVPDEELAELTEKRAKIREKRARKKANQKAKKADAAAAQAAEEQLAREQLQAAAASERKVGLLQPHESLSRLLKSRMPLDPLDMADGDGKDSSSSEESIG